MPTLAPVNNVIRTRILGSIASDSWGIRCFWHCGSATGPYTDAECADLASAVFTYFGSDMMVYLPSQVQVNRVEAEDLTTGSAGFGIGSGAAVHGGETGAPPPAGVAACLNFTIGSRYRGGHPRVYLPGGTTSNLADARSWTTSFRGQIEGQWNAFLAHVQASSIGVSLGVGQVAVRYRSGGVALVPPEVFDVLAVALSPVVASQRRRYNR